MNIAVCVKLTPDAEDIQTRPDGSISLERAEWIISGFDLQAIEAARQLADATGGRVTAISAGPRQIDNSRLKKDILSRGPDALFMVVDDGLANADSAVTAQVLVEALRRQGPFDLLLCGEGSADLYFQQVGLQVGERLEQPALNFISKIEPLDGGVLVERSLEDAVEVLEVPLPAVLMVTTDINLPRLPGMKDILMAGKKPVTQVTLAELGFATPPQAQAEVLETRAPRQAQRKQVMIPGTVDEAVQALVGYLAKEGLV